MYTLQTPVEEISYLASKVLPALQRLGIQNVEDLLWHVPFRYEDWSRITPLGEIKEEGDFCVQTKVVALDVRRVWRRNLILIEGVLEDETGSCKVTWFNQRLIAQVLKPKDIVVLCGHFEKKGRLLLLKNPIYEKLTSKRFTHNLIHTGRIVPQYHLTFGITQKQLRALVWHVLEKLKTPEEIHPRELLQKEQLIDLGIAFQEIHFPKNQKSLESARERLAFDELFKMHRRIFSMKKDLEKSVSIRVPFLKQKTQEFVESLPFTLTDDQKKAAWAILKDMDSGKVMNRLLNGDVGSGKTVVVAMGILNVALNSLQSAFLCPTEVLARQHFDTLCTFFQNFPMGLALYTRSSQYIRRQTDIEPIKISKEELKKEIQSGKIHVVIGTHALLTEENQFSRLALAVVDEQHRFGVKQRSYLRSHAGIAGITPHFLSLSATPIPRTLFLAFFADLDVSTIHMVPSHRKKIQTRIFSKEQRSETYAFIQKEIEKGHQAFIVCPLVSESDVLGVKSVEQEYKKFVGTGHVLCTARIGELHGKLKAVQKEKIMADFKNKKIDVLISTSVIEVGIDVPNATIMLIEDPQRFGLAQLHQFRGRVGRGIASAYCFLISDHEDLHTVPRIKYFAEISDGFELSQRDLELRGGGDVDGVRQSGLPAFKVARLSDFDLSRRAQTWAK